MSNYRQLPPYFNTDLSNKPTNNGQSVQQPQQKQVTSNNHNHNHSSNCGCSHGHSHGSGQSHYQNNRK